MPEFLSDPAAGTYVVLAVAAAIAVVYWYRTQTRRTALIAGGVLAVCAAFYGINVLFESPREEAVRRVNAMVVGMNESRPRAFAEHVSDRFQYANTTKATIESARLWALLREHGVRIAVWDFDRGYVERPDPDTLNLGFMAMVEGDGGKAAFFVKANFARDPDGAFRVRGFTVYSDAMRKTNGPVYTVPGIP